MRKNSRTSVTEIEQNNNKKKISILLLFGVILLGTLIGTITFSAMPDNQVFNSDILNNGFMKHTTSMSVFEAFLSSFKNTAVFIAMLFLFGLCAVSQPAEVFILFYRGMALGISISSTYYAYGFKGLPMALLMILPHAVLSSVILILAVRESVKLSNIFAGFAFSDKKNNEFNPQVKLYFIKYVVLLVLLVLSSLLDSVLMAVFKGFL